MQIIKNILTNNIISIWIAPVITSLIGSIILGIFIHQRKNNLELIKTVNDRYINCIRQYIIQRIKIDKKVITDIRNIIIEESGLKEKYIYNELSLRNKIITDISENKYINEEDKMLLINETYNDFKDFEMLYEKSNVEENENSAGLFDVFVLIVITIVYGVIITNLIFKLDGFSYLEFIIYALIVITGIGVIIFLVNKNSVKK